MPGRVTSDTNATIIGNEENLFACGRNFRLGHSPRMHSAPVSNNVHFALRQYFPKGADPSVYSQTHLNKVARQLNERPRKTFGFATPAERFNACVASTS